MLRFVKIFAIVFVTGRDDNHFFITIIESFLEWDGGGDAAIEARFLADEDRGAEKWQRR